MNMIIREYKSTDYDGVFKLLHNVYHSKIHKNTLEKHYLNDNKKILVAVDGDVNKVIGTIFISHKLDYIRLQSTLFFSYLAVNKKYRNKGVATMLLKNAEIFCNTWKCKTMECTSANYRLDVHRLYAKLGFSKKKTTVFIKEIKSNF